jgi:hypothetical protein
MITPLADAVTTADDTKVSCALKLAHVRALSVQSDFPQRYGMAVGHAFQHMSLSPVYPEMQYG